MKQSANDIQHGGSHYKRHEYQHWDFVTDLELPYLLACASKYLSRWDQKNGREDILKSGHYLDKAEERGIRFFLDSSEKEEMAKRYCGQLAPLEAQAVMAICLGQNDIARGTVATMLGLVPE